MTQEQHHVELVKGIAEQLKPILAKSGQAIYIYLDDTHKTCNKNFATLLGYKSVKEWSDTDARLADVIESNQPAVISAYENATEKFEASTINVAFKHIKTGARIKIKMIMVPMAYDGHVFTVQFLSKI